MTGASSIDGDTTVPHPSSTASPSAAALRQGDYARPQQGWVCGHADGTQCRLGPDQRGRCRAGPLCRPRRDGDRWLCCLPASVGGPCEDGPQPDGRCCQAVPPCAPRASLRTLRGRVVRWAFGLSIGLLLIALHGSGRDAWVSSGPISIHHGTVQDCAACHGGYAAGPTGWLLAALDPSRRRDDGDMLCLSCHAYGDTPFNPHAQPASRLETLADEIRARTDLAPPVPFTLAASAALFAPANLATASVSCRSCHREHRGRSADLTRVSDAECQGCHTLRFASLVSGHPEIDHLLTDRRQRIRFDHNGHFDRYFAEGAVADLAPATCSACHALGPNGHDMVTKSFEDGCAACHIGDVTGMTAVDRKGVAVLTVPGLDLLELSDRGIDIGGWPEFSEEPLTPFLEHLLRTDPAVATALDVIAPLDLLDLRQATAAQMTAVAEIAIAIKHLIGHLLTEGMTMADAMLAPLRADVPKADTASLLALLPYEVVRDAQQAWFPDLAAEMARPLPMLPDPVPGPGVAVAMDIGADLDEAILPVDDGDILGGLGPPADDGDILDGLGPPADDGDILGGLGPPADDGDILGGLGPPADDGDILGGLGPPADDGDILGGLGPPADDGDILGGLDISPGASNPLGGFDAAADPAVGTQEPAVLDPATSEEDWMAVGGWYRQDQALLYRPAGHADRFLHAWLDVAAAKSGDAGSNFGDRLLAVIGAERSPGQCLSCHSVDAAGGLHHAHSATSGLRVNWTAVRPDPRDIGFTVFSHAEHFSLVEVEGCEHCHPRSRIVDPDRFRAQFAGHDPTATVNPDFGGPKVATCADCHTIDAAGDACTLCHRYHVGRFPPRLPEERTRATADSSPSDRAFP